MNDRIRWVAIGLVIVCMGGPVQAVVWDDDSGGHH